MAAHAAGTALGLAECVAAVVGGVNAMLWSGTTVGICQLGALSRVGRCQSLEAAADGYGRGEGFAVLVLTAQGTHGEDRGARSEASPPPAAMLAATAVNQDGRSSSLTAPNGPAQTRLIAAALLRASLRAQDVQTLGLHGTGTALGDPLEVGAAAAALSSSVTGQNPEPLSLVAVKSCYGHTEGAAGRTRILLKITRND